MTDCGRDMLQEYLGDCYNVQLELEDLSGSFETLISDIELVVIGELSENLERIRDNLQKVEEGFADFNRLLQRESSRNNSQKLLQD